MMFLIGQGERVQAVGPPEPQHCACCGEERAFVPRLRYAYGQMDLLFGFTYGHRYELACTDCGHGWRLDRRAARQAYGPPPIPFHLRYGWAVLIALVGIIGVAAWLHGRAG